MFLRSVKAPNGRHEYLRLVESVREGKKVKQRVVAHLGRKDQLAPHLDTLIRLLQDETQAPRWVAIHDVSAPRASTWGPILVARHLFNQLSLGTILDAERPLRRHRQRAHDTPIRGPLGNLECGCRILLYFCLPFLILLLLRPLVLWIDVQFAG